ncbi:MAG: hypothetical protein QNJ44_11610 [Rhodobacter sp.]|nr:hypothetical protein [Rhodobacter sp.]
MTGGAAPAVQSELQCRACGGQRVFDPATQALRCTSCGAAEALAAAGEGNAAAEWEFRPGRPTPIPGGEERVHSCRTCGGEVIFRGQVLSRRCPYCDGPVVQIEQDPGFRPMALIPFRVASETALQNARDWVRGRWAVPGDLMQAVGEARVAGLYAPFWTFDSHEAVRYWAKYRHDPWWSDDHVWKNITGTMKVEFDDMLMPASDHVTPIIRDGILHEFDPASLHPADPGYLAGFAAERHGQSVMQGLEANRSDRDLLIKARIRAHVGKPGARVVRYETDTSGIRYRRLLLPVWILHYRYDGTPFRVAVSGIDGRAFGERPFSRVKLLAISGLLALSALIAGAVYGAIAAGTGLP